MAPMPVPHMPALKRAKELFVLGAIAAAMTMPHVAEAAQKLGLGASSDNPIQVYADNGIEWDKNARQYIARGNAKAIQGTTTVYGDTLIAYYEDIGGGNTQVYRLDALGNVRILSPNETAFGKKAVYDVRKGVLVMTGDNLKLVTPTEVITARDSLEYYEQKSMAVARGNAVSSPTPKGTTSGSDNVAAVGGGSDRTVRADVLTAHFREAGNAGTGAGSKEGGGQQSIEHMEAFGNVVVNRPGEVSKGARGAYFPDRDVAHLWDNVRITRGDNQLNGEFAEVNFKTGISRILSGASAPVQALIEPEKKPQNPTSGN